VTWETDIDGRHLTTIATSHQVALRSRSIDMNISSGAIKCLAYIVLAYALAQTAAFGADLATPAVNATTSAEDAGSIPSGIARRLAS
jgi:hypothetical protein